MNTSKYSRNLNSPDYNFVGDIDQILMDSEMREEPDSFYCDTAKIKWLHLKKDEPMTGIWVQINELYKFNRFCEAYHATGEIVDYTPPTQGMPDDGGFSGTGLFVSWIDTGQSGAIGYTDNVSPSQSDEIHQIKSLFNKIDSLYQKVIQQWEIPPDEY